MEMLADPSPITLEALGQVLTSVGLSATLLLFFVWWLYNSQLRIAKENLDRETRVASEVAHREKLLIDDFKSRYEVVITRLQSLEDFSRDTLMGLAKDTGAALAQNTTALQNNTAALERSHQATQVSFEAITALRDELRAHDSLARELAQRMEKGRV